MFGGLFVYCFASRSKIYYTHQRHHHYMMVLRVYLSLGSHGNDNLVNLKHSKKCHVNIHNIVCIKERDTFFLTMNKLKALTGLIFHLSIKALSEGLAHAYQ